MLIGACALEQKMAIEVIDAPLRTHGDNLKASRAPRGELHLGPYRAKAITRAHATGGEALLPDRQPRPSSFYSVGFELDADGRPWTIACRAERRIARNADLAAATDEGHDEVALACTLADPAGARWSLRALGDVGKGLAGEVRAGAGEGEGGSASASEGAAADAFEVEVITVRRFIKAIDRELPFPVAQLRRRGAAAAAMLLARPEQAWLAPRLPQPERDLAMAAMIALRLLPLGEVAE